MLGRPLAYLHASGLAIAGITLALVLVTPGTARAQSACDAGVDPTPDFTEVANFPSASERDVPIDGLVRIRYANRVPPHPFIKVETAAASMPTLVPGDVNVVDNEVHWHAREQLAPNTLYQVTFTELSDSNVFTFTTGSVASVDWATAAASGGGGGGDASVVDGSGGGGGAFQGLLADDPSNVTWEKAGATDECGDPDAIRVTLNWHDPPNTHWPVSDIEFVIYETRGPGVGGPLERARTRGRVMTNDCADGFEQCTSFRLTPANASGPVCFNLQALDPYGRADGNTNERCFDPSVGPFFQGCEAGPRHGEVAGSRGWMALAAVGALAVLTAAGVRGRRPRS